MAAGCLLPNDTLKTDSPTLRAADARVLGAWRDGGASDRLDLAVEVGLVGVAALGGNARGGVARREKVSGVVEAHQLRGAFGCEADLGSEAGGASR